MGSQIPQGISQVVLKATAVIEVHSGCNKIWLLEKSNFRAAETSVLVCGSPLCKLCWGLGATFSQQWLLWLHHHNAFLFQICLCHSHKLCYIIWRHIISTFLYIHTYGDTGIMEMLSVTASISLEDPRVCRHHCIIWNTHSMFPSSLSHTLLPNIQRSMQFVWFLTYSWEAFIYRHNFCGSSWRGIPSDPLTLILPYSNQNPTYSWISLNAMQCAGDFLRCDLCLLATLFRHIVTEWNLRCTRRALWSKVGDIHGRRIHGNLYVVIVRVCRYPWRQCWSEFGDALGGHDWANVERHLENVIVQTWKL